jgi:hypothetical protein
VEEIFMKTIKAKIMDPTHLELSQPIPAPPGRDILITISEPGDVEEAAWRDAASQHLLQAYDEQDSIYDAV